MIRLKPFLDNYDLLLFDMDGVITSEQAYWTCAALTVYEMRHSAAHFGTEQVNRSAMLAERERIRREVFLDDSVIALLKDKGVNSNWDLAYVTLCAVLSEGSYKKAYAYLCTLGENILNDYDALARRLRGATGRSFEACRRSGPVWHTVVDVFQSLYRGEDGIPGLIESEAPLFPIEQTRQVLSALKAGGKTLGVGSGRPRYEIITPLTRWGLLGLFDSERIVTYDEVEAGERAVPGAVLTKPHPYMFLKGTFGAAATARQLVAGSYDREQLKRTLVIGDAGADILAAHDGGMDFLAVLTGVSGEKARSYFESEHAEYILGSVCELIEGEGLEG